MLKNTPKTVVAAAVVAVGVIIAIFSVTQNAQDAGAKRYGQAGDNVGDSTNIPDSCRNLTPDNFISSTGNCLSDPSYADMVVGVDDLPNHPWFKYDDGRYLLVVCFDGYWVDERDVEIDEVTGDLTGSPVARYWRCDDTQHIASRSITKGAKVFVCNYYSLHHKECVDHADVNGYSNNSGNKFLLVDIIIFIGLYVIYFMLRLRRQTPFKIITKTLFWAYIATMLLLTVSPMQIITSGNVDFSLARMNFHAFQYNLSNEIISNILLFVPLGFLLPLAYPKMKDFTILIAILVSIVVEISQQSIGRVSDLTDIVNNSIGGALGFYCYIVMMLIIKSFRDRVPAEKKNKASKS